MGLAGAASTINYLAVLVAAVVTFVIGGLWYSPVLFDKPWRHLNALSEEQIKASHTGLIFGLSFVAALISAYVLALFLAGPATDVVAVVMAGLLVGTGAVHLPDSPGIGVERRPHALNEYAARL